MHESEQEEHGRAAQPTAPFVPEHRDAEEAPEERDEVKPRAHTSVPHILVRHNRQDEPRPFGAAGHIL
eukprot:1017581-Rhodomonas_salina.1